MDLLKPHSVGISLFKEPQSVQPFPRIFNAKRGSSIKGLKIILILERL